MSVSKVDARRAAGQKDLFDMLNTMREAAWNGFDRRRDHEWKICIAFWGLLAAIGAGLVGNQIPLSHRDKVAAVILVLALGFLHHRFTGYLANALRIDRIKELFYDERIRAMLGVHFGPEFLQRVETSRGQWSHGQREQAKQSLPELTPKHCAALEQALYDIAKEDPGWAQEAKDYKFRLVGTQDCRKCEAAATCGKMLPRKSTCQLWSHRMQMWLTWVLVGADIWMIVLLTPRVGEWW